MAKYTNEIHYNVTTDFKDNGLNKLNQEIINIQNRLKNLTLEVKDSSDIDRITAKLDKFRDAINQSYNFRLKTTDLTKMNVLLEKSGISIRDLAKDFAALGNQGRVAFMQINNELSRFMTQAKSVSAVTQKIWNTIGNTVRWGIISNGFQSVLTSISQATGYIKSLDKSLTDIRLVSSYSAQEMQRFAEQANKAAKALGSTTVAYTDASAIFVQQGMSLNQAEKMADLTIKVSNITGQTTSEVSEQITAWMNGYQLQAEELQRTLDSVVKVAAVSAADTEEIMTAASKVASTASTVGVSTDQLIAQMSTIISVTREAPEAVGNAMKTIYSRLSSLKLGETLEDNVTLNSMTKTLEKIGVQVLDDNNNLRDMGTIIEELQQKWVDLSEAQKMAASVQLAGRYQLNRFLALMNNQEYYQNMMNAANNATGFLNEKQAVYLESLEGHLETLRASIEGIATVGLDTNDFNDLLETFTGITDSIGTMVEAVGGFQSLLLIIGPILLKTFSGNIADSVVRFSNNLEQSTLKIKNLQEANKALQTVEELIISTFSKGDNVVQEVTKSLEKLIKIRRDSGANLSAENQQQLNMVFEQSVDILQQYIDLQEREAELSQKVSNQQTLFEEQGFTINKETGRAQDISLSLFDEDSKLTAESVKALNEQLKIGVKRGMTYSEVIERADTSLLKTKGELDKVQLELADVGASAKAAGNNINEVSQSLEKTNFFTSATKLLGTLAQLVMGIQVFSQAQEVLADGKLFEDPEKTNQFLIDMSMGLGMIFSAISPVIDKFKTFKKEAKELKVVQENLTQAQKAYNTAIKEGTLIDILDSVSNLTDAQKLYNKELFNLLKSKAGEFVVNTTSKIKLLGSTLLSFLSSTPGRIIAVTAALIALGAAWNNVLSPAAIQRKREEEFTKAIQEQAAAYGKVKDEYDDLIKTFSSYKDAKDALSELTAGSEEWRSKIEEIDELVNDLIQKYPELADKIVPSAEGGWYIPDSLMEETLSQKARERYSTGMGLAFTNARSPYNKDSTEYQQDIDAAGRYLIQAVVGYARESGANFSQYEGGESVLVKALLSDNNYLQMLRDHYLSPELVSDNLLSNFGEDVIAFNPEEAEDLVSMYSKLLGDLSSYTKSIQGNNVVTINKEELRNLNNLVYLTSGYSNAYLQNIARGDITDLALQAYDNYMGRRTQLINAGKDSLINYDAEQGYQQVVEDIENGRSVYFLTNDQKQQFLQQAEAYGFSQMYPDQFNNIYSKEDEYKRQAEIMGEDQYKLDNVLQHYADTILGKEGAEITDEIKQQFFHLVDAVGGYNNYILSQETILAQKLKGIDDQTIAKEIDISEFYLTIDELDEAIKSYFGEADNLIKYYTDNIIQAQKDLGIEIDEDQARQVLAQKAISTNAAQRLAEGYEENFANLSSTNEDTKNFAKDFFATNIADLFGIPVEQITYEMIDQINEEGLLNEGLWEKDSETIRQIVTILDGMVNFNTQGHDYYNSIQERIAKNNINTETIIGELEDAGVDLDTDRGQTLLRLLGLQDIGENGEHLFVPLEIGIATVEQALDDFAQALIATGKTEEEARDIAAEQKERIKNLGFTEDQQQQILTAAIQNPDLLLADDKYLENLIAQSQEGIYSFSDLLNNMIRQVSIETKNITPDIIQDWAQEMGLSVEDLDIKAHQLMQENEGKFENVKDAIINIYETWTNEQAQIQEARNNAIESLINISKNDTQEDVEAIIDKFDNEEELEEFIDFRKALGPWYTIEDAYDKFQEQLLERDWASDSEKTRKYIENLGYDWEQFLDYQQEALDDGAISAEYAAKVAKMRLDNEATALKEQEEALKATQEYIEETEALANAQQAMIGLKEQYTATGQFGNLANPEDLNNFSNLFTTAIGRSADDLITNVFKGSSEQYEEMLQEVIDSGALAKAIEGDASDLIALLKRYNVEVSGDIETVFSTFLYFMEQAEIEVGSFGQALLNAFPNMSGYGAQNFENYYQQIVDKLGLDQDTAEQYLTTALESGYTDLLTEGNMTDLAEAARSNGANILEQLAQEISERDFNANKWANSYEGTKEIASQFDKTREQFDDEAKELFPDLKTIQEQRIALYNLLKEQDESYQAQLQQTIETLHNNNPSENVEDIEKLLSELSEEELALFTAWDEVNGRGKSTEESLAAWQESRDQTPWSSSEAGQQKYFRENDYSTEDEDKYNQYLQEEIDNYVQGIIDGVANGYGIQASKEDIQSNIADNVYQQLAEQAAQRVEEERSLTEAAEERLAQEQRQINAQQAIKELYREYSEEGFSLDDPATLQNIRKQLGSIFDMTAEELETALGEGGLEKLVNSDAFKDFMSGDKSAIANLENVLKEAGLNVDELDISLEDLFILAQQGIEEVEKTLQETISDILQIIKNISEGDTVSDDQYKLLVEQLGQEAVDQYFTTMADGTHMLIGAADEFKQNAMAITRGKIVGQLTKVNNQSEAGDNDYLTSYNPDEEKFYTEQLLSTAETLEELQALRDLTLEINTVQETSFNAYNESLLRLGMNYENATDEVKAFREAQASGNEENIAAAQRDLEGSIAIGEDQSLKELDLDPAEIDDYADHLQDLAAMEEDVYLGGEKLANSLEEDEGAAAMLSKQLTRMNRAVGTLEKNWDDWADVLQNSSKGSEEYFDAMQSTRSAMSDLLDISEDFISADLVDSLANNAENMELMQRAAEGDGEAIDQLRQLALEDIVVNITEQNHLDPDFLSNQIANIQAMLPDIEIGATVSAVDDSELINALNSMIIEAGMTKDQVNALLGSMGFSGNFASETQTVPNKIAITTTEHHRDYHAFDDKGNPTDWTDVETASTDYIDADGFTTTFAFATAPQGEVAVPQLNSITRKAPGSANNYSPSNLGGNGGKGKGSGGGGGGKGGGGGSSKKNQADPIEKEKDRYQKVNEQIAKTVAEYDQLTEAQDRLLGPELAMNLEEQNEKLEEQIDLQKEKLRIQREEQRDRQKDLSQYGIQFNPDGTISNYSEVWDAQNAKLEAARQAYNGTDTDDEAAKEAWEAAQAYFDDFAEGITKYDSLLESIYDTNSELQSLRNAIDDLSKSIVETAYDSLNSLQDLDDTMAEVRLNLSDPFGDDIWKQLESATDRLSDWFQMDEEDANTAYNSLINQAQKLMDKTTDKAEKESLQRYIDNARSDLNSGSTGYLDMWNAQTNNLLKEYNDLMTTGSNKSGLSAGSLHELMDTAFGDGAEKLSSLVDQLQNARDLALDAMDEISDKFEDRKEQYEVINDELEHQLELSEMLHGDQAYAEQEKILHAQIENSKGQLGIAAEQVKLYEAWSKNAIEGTEEWKKANELLTDAQKDYNEQVEKAVELTKKLYENTINSQLDKWIQNALGNDMDWVQEEWELIQRNAEQYLDDVEKAYNIQKLQNSYEDLLNQSNQLDIQQQITDQMNQQLGYLRGKTQLSKYDVDYANAQLEILQRQIALEEARRNKNQMRLSRDAQGNYSYVYTANRDDINNAESGLLDAQFNAYNLSKQNIIDSQSNALSALNDFYSSAQAIATNYNLSEEERAARLQSLWDYNREYLQGCAEQLGTSFENIQNDFYGMVDALEDINEGNLTEWTQRLKDGTMDMTMVMSEILSDAIFDWLTKFENFELDTYAVISQMLDSWNEYTMGLIDMSTSAGESIDNITGATQQCVEQTNKLTESQAGFFDLLEKQAGTVDNYLTQMQGYADTIANLEGQMSQYKDNMETLEKILRENYISYELNGELVDNSKKSSGGNSGNGKGGSGNGSGGNGSGSGGKTSNGTKFTNEELIEGVAGNIWTYGSWANDPTRAGDLAKKFGADMAVAIQQFVNRGMEALTHDWTTGYYRQFGIDAFATGGYTGSWDGGDGKLAILDSKELVLNAKDTENMLAAVNLVREVVRSMQGTTLSSGLSSLSGAFSSAASTVDQNVTITANFPNATSESEIKSAILGLVDQSVQYSARTKPTGKVF